LNSICSGNTEIEGWIEKSDISRRDMSRLQCIYRFYMNFKLKRYHSVNVVSMLVFVMIGDCVFYEVRMYS
jgi:hypothetical protein